MEKNDNFHYSQVKKSKNDIFTQKLKKKIFSLKIDFLMYQKTKFKKMPQAPVPVICL
jgi:hypothetical protein